jgi:FKBP-type peptidyl-prolyl cis-trans isomerase (trigger factor)
MKATNIKVSRDKVRWEAEVLAEIPAEAMATYREEALKEIQKEAKLDGFRPGKAPLERILQIYGEGAVMRAAAERAIQSELPEILAKEQLPVVETPKVTTDTPESGKPLKFTARAALAPEIKLADHTKIAEAVRTEKEDTSVSDTEHAEALTHLRRERARIDKVEAGTEPAKAAEESRSMKEEELPALDDAFVQSLGYESAEAFSTALRENIKTEKELRAQEKRRAAILDRLAGESTISYPAILKEFELDEMEARFKDDLARGGYTFEAFLTEQKKSREELRASWEAAADKRAKVRLVLGEVARQEHIEPDEASLAHELEHAKQHYPQADAETLRVHIAHALRNEMVIRFLESGKKEPLPAHDHDHSHEH